MKNTQFAIGIPTINRADLLNETLKKYARDFRNTEIYILDNGRQQDLCCDYPNVTLLRPQGAQNLGVARSWNALCYAIFYGDLLPLTAIKGPSSQAAASQGKWLPVAQPVARFPIAWILNDDVYQGSFEGQVQDWLDSHSHLFDFAAPPSNWSNFMIKRSLYETIGTFDNKFYPAYYEDNDYRYRMQRRRSVYLPVDWLQPEIFRVSASREKDPTLNARIGQNLQYYRTKWGGPPGEETFRMPFDGE